MDHDIYGNRIVDAPQTTPQTTLKALSAVVDRLRAAAAPDMALVEADMLKYGKAFYQVSEDGSFRHVPVADVLADSEIPAAAPKVGLNYPDCTYPRCKEKGSECSGCHAALAPNPRNVLADPEIPVTAEMNTAAACVLIEAGFLAFPDFMTTAIYRAMAAIAPKAAFVLPPGLVVLPEGFWIERKAHIDALKAENATLSGRVDELQSYSHELAENLDERNAKDQESEAYQYLKRLFLHMAPQCCVLPDLLGVCTQVDNAIAGLEIDNAALKSELAAMRVAPAQQTSGTGGGSANSNVGGSIVGESSGSGGGSAAGGVGSPSAVFRGTHGVSPASHLERRADGTLKPAAKAWEAPKRASDPRRIGG